ncbi:helix-turn-helix domain-containing protein [Noviherbaspirillum galbum]|uniref:Helix-turn-helix transcriptional regulator n=1 Tax=Noviherbaspirillum galbum TaxID=2709383 RepID=A0A6B3SXB8_9BURK|nr:helix-turn-helix transcriptional regulator [Noviherbaspirillum galbum]NEX63756.1 helix-turn-helix transcriptional regulator [Noviherbaspirillum galbum]
MTTTLSFPAASGRSAGDYLREWRQRRRMSQLDLALEAEISTRHLSFMETGRATPSREMVLRLSERLDVPLRERNAWLMAAGYAPMYSERKLDDPVAGPARKAMELVLAGHEPYPALAVDQHWNLVMHNRAVPFLLKGVSAALLAPPVNVLRLALHPEGLAPRIVNYMEWRGHLLARLRQQISVSDDAVLKDLLEVLAAYPMPAGQPGRADQALPGHDVQVVVPLRFDSEAGLLSLISTTTVFGTPVDVTFSELALESFFPADAATAAILRRVAGEE